MVIQKGDEIQPNDLPLAPVAAPEPAHTEAESLAEHEKHYIQEVLNSTEGNVSRAARILQIDRVTLYNKIRKYNLKR